MKPPRQRFVKAKKSLSSLLPFRPLRKTFELWETGNKSGRGRKKRNLLFHANKRKVVVGRGCGRSSHFSSSSLLLSPNPKQESHAKRKRKKTSHFSWLQIKKRGGGEGPLPRKSLHEARVLLPVQVKSPKLCPLSLRPLVCLAGFLSSLPMTYSRPARRCTYVHIAAAVTTKPGGEDVCNWIVRGARRVGEGEPMHYIRPPPSPRFLFFLRGGGESRLIALPRFPFSPMAAAAAAAADKKPQTT